MKINHFYSGLILIGLLVTTLFSHSADPEVFLQPPGLRVRSDPAIVIPATYRYLNQKLALPEYRSAAGTPLQGWSRKFIKTRRFSSDQSAWIYFRPSDLKRSKMIKNAGIPDSLRIWPTGATLVLEGYKGDATQMANVELLEIEIMTKLEPAQAAPAEKFFPMDWSYARYTPDSTRSLSKEKLIECHQCHSIAFRLTGDLIFTPFRQRTNPVR